jgi:hypothetical protein
VITWSIGRTAEKMSSKNKIVSAITGTQLKKAA